MTAAVDEQALMQLNVGDYVAIMTRHMDDGKMHWTLGTVETPPYLRDVEIRLWERQRVDYYNENETPRNPETAELMSRIAHVKVDLQKSISQSEGMTRQLRDRRAAIMQRIADAEQYVQESDAVRNAARDDIESIQDRHWQELKSYRIPPKMVLVVIRAVMLLLSEDEARTWPQIQRVLRDFNFKRRITGYDPAQQLSAERRDYILQECVSKRSFRYDRAMQGSVAVGPIYYWVLAQLDCGEARAQMDAVDQEKVSLQRELREVLRHLNEQQKRIAEYQELMDDLNDQLRMCNQHESSVSRSRARGGQVADRYAESFAAREGKEYLKPAFYVWRPTERVIIVLRKNIVGNFGRVTDRQREDGRELNDTEIRELDHGLQRRLAQQDRDDDEELEGDMFRKHEGPEEVTVELHRRFEGKGWRRTLDRKRDAVVLTFAAESAACLEVPDYYISIQDLTLGSLVVSFTATHDGTRDKIALQRAVDSFGYPRTLALYEEDSSEEEEEGEGPEHQMKFGGDLWSDLVPQYRAVIEEAFLTDTSAATGAYKDEIEVQDIRVEDGDGLTVDYSMANKNLDPADVQEQVDAYAYPEVWALYQQLAGLAEVGPTHQVRFRGERWADIMVGNEAEIQVAFAEDAAEALGITRRQVRPDEMRYESGLTVPYTVAGCSLDDDEVDMKTEGYDFPKTWALYDRLVAEAAGADYQKAFEGEHWERVLQAARPEVSEAFCTDTANAISGAPNKVDARSVDTDQDRLLVSYNVGDSKNYAEDVRGDTQQYPYPEMWALYQQVVTEEAEGTDFLSQRFDGEAWQAIQAALPKKVQAAFKEDVCAATGLPASRVTVNDIKTSGKGMTVEYGVSREEDEPAHAVRKATSTAEYPLTWALYEEYKDNLPALSGLKGRGDRESGVLQRRFEGDDWDILIDGCPQELNSAFKKDAARTLGKSERDIRIVNTKLGSLIVDYQVLDPEDEDEKLQRRIDGDDFPELMKLYRARVRSGDGENGAAATRARAGAAGSDQEAADRGAADRPTSEKAVSERAASEKPVSERATSEKAVSERAASEKPVSERATSEKAVSERAASEKPVSERATSEKAVSERAASEKPVSERATSEKAVSERAASEKPVSERATSEKAVSERAASEKPVSERAASARAVSEQVPHNLEDMPMMQFPGPEWEDVLAGRKAAVESAFQRDTADALGVQPEQVDVRTCTADGEALQIEYTVQQCLNSAEDAEDAVAAYEYPMVWMLYPDESDEGRYKQQFIAPNWDNVVEERERALKRAFQEDVAACLDVQPHEVNVRSVRATDNALKVRYSLLPADGGAEPAGVEEQCSAYNYPRTWALYEDVVEKDWVTTSHQVGFDGADWGYVVQDKLPELQEAFMDCTTALFDTRLGNIREVNYAIGSLLVDFVFKHPAELATTDINKALNDCPYEPVWDLYGYHPYIPSEMVRTTHEVGFDGAGWPMVLEENRAAVLEAFQRDTAAALDATPEDVQVEDTAFEDNCMVFKTAIQHHIFQDNELMEEQLSRYPYDSVWALYEEDANAGYTTTNHQVGFGGEDWEFITEAHRTELASAFAFCTGEMIDVPDDHVTIVSMEATPESLLYNCEIKHPVELTTDEVNKMLADCNYTEVWDIYLDHPYDPNEVVTTEQEVGFEGDEWNKVIASELPELQQALCRDTAEALEVSPSDIKNVRPEVRDGELMVVTMDVCHSVLQDPELIQEQLARCPYQRVWKLYEELPPSPAEEWESGVVERRFDGDDWDILIDGCPNELNDAFRRDAARALGVPEKQVVVVSTEIGSLLVKFKVKNPVHEDGTLQRMAEEDEFPEVMGLYRARVRSRDEENEAAATRAAAAERELAEQKAAEQAEQKAAEQAEQKAAEQAEQKAAEQAVRDKAVADAASSGAYVRNFPGNWDECIAENRPELEEAFGKDTAAALHVPGERIQVRNITANEENMYVDFDVAPQEHAGEEVEADHDRKTPEPDTINSLVNDYAYPGVWALYGNETLTTAHALSFESPNWAYIVRRRRWELARALSDDAGEAIGLDADAVTDCRMEALEDSLAVTTYIRHPLTMPVDDVAKCLDDAPFKRVWALYELAAPSGKLKKTFPGVRWPEVEAKNNAALQQAVAEDTAKILHISRLEVEVIELAASEKQGLTATYVVHGSAMSDGEMRSATDNGSYPNVWTLYGGATGGLRDFDGESWGAVSEEQGKNVEKAFREDTAFAAGVAEDDVEIYEVNADDSGLHVQYGIRPTARPATPTPAQSLTPTGEEVEKANTPTPQESPSRAVAEKERADSAMAEKVRQYDYPRVWNLYHETCRAAALKALGERESGQLQRVFPGDDWDIVLEGCPEDAKGAFKKGVANTVGVPSSNVVVVGAKLGSLIMDYKVRGCPLEDDEIGTKIGDHDFPELMELYRARVRTRDEENESAARAKAEKETAEQAEKDRKEEEKRKADEARETEERETQAAKADEKARDLEESREAEVREVQAAKSDQQARGLDEAAPEEVTQEDARAAAQEPQEVTQHQVGFDGEDWPYVVETNESALKEAFAADTSERMGISADNVSNIRASVDEQLLLEFDAMHSVRQSQADVDEHLRKCPYNRLWELYGKHPYTDEDRVTTVHEVGFEGDDWDYVLETSEAELARVFRTATGKALKMPVSDVGDAEPEMGDDGIIVTCELTHSNTISRETLDEALKAYAYEEMWALYRTRPYDEKSKEVTVHELTFEGDGWAFVCELHGEQLRRAVVEDSAAALSLENRDIVDVENTASETGLITRIKVRHSPLQDNELIQEELSRYEYENVWALYESSMETRVMTKTFAGELWPKVMDRATTEVANAFVMDTSNMLNLPPRFLDVKGTQSSTRGLTVEYTVLGQWFPEEEVEKRAAAYEFPEVWRIYNEEAAKAAEPYERLFPGTHWENVVAERPLALKRAFQIDTADAFNGRVRQENVVVTATELNPEELLVKFTAPTINGDAGKAEGEAAVTDYAYPVVWELYRDVESRIAPPLPPSALIETTTQNCNFKGEDWDYVWETKEEAVKDAFGKGVSDALGLDRESITDVVMEKSADGIAVGGRVTHVLSQKSEWIQEALKRHPFAEMWALYESRPIDYSKLTDTEHKLIFEGEDWVPVMEAKRAEVETAVRKDTAEALGGKEEDVLDVQLSTDEAALTAVLVTRHTIARTTNDVDKTLTRCDYDRVWDLYRDVVTALPPLTETTTQDCGFEGEDWDYVWETQEQAVREAFTTGVAEALGLEPAAVTDMTMEKTADGIIFGATVTHPPSQEYDDIQEALTKHPFAELWVLYEPRPFDPTVTIDTDHALSFEGDRWATVMARQAADVEAAIRKDTAAALEVEESNVTEVKTEVTEKALLVTATVRHSPLQDAEFIEEQLSSFDYDTVWGLYSDVLAPAEGSKHFDGVHWAEIIVRDEDGVVKAFNTDAATATQTKESEVDVMELAADANGLDVTYMVSDTAKPADAANQDLQTYAYPTLWDHYRAKEDVIEKERAAAALKALGERESGQLQRVFPGDDWDIVLEGCPEDAKGAFKKGVANTVGVPSSNVVVVGAKLGSLIMDYKVRGCPLEDDEIGTKIGDHDFPELMELYRARVRTRDEENESAARAKAEKETAEQAEKDRKEEEKRKADEARETEERETQAAKADEKARDLEESREAEVREVQAAKSDQQARGLDEAAPEEVTQEDARAAAQEPQEVTQHQVGFDGEDWPYVVETNESALKEAFAADTSERMGISADNVSNIRASVDEQLLLEFDAMHSVRQSQADVDEHLRKCPYNRLWELYGKHPYTDEDRVTTVHEVGFEGDDWDYVLETSEAELARVFRTATGKALKMPVSDVGDAEPEMGDDGIIVTCELTHSNTISRETLDEALKAYAYEEMWALYRTRPYDEKSKEVTVHELTFEGDGWAFVCELHGEQLRRAVVEDSAAALSLENRDIVDVENTASETGLITRIKVRHSPLQDNELIQEELSRYEYENVWALYESSMETRVMTKTFAGELWPKVMDRATTEVANAFVMDTSNMLNLPPRFLDVKGTQSSTRGLTVEYTVLGQWFPEEEVEKRAAAYEFPEVWRIYNEEAAKAAEPYERLFPGTHWENVVAERPLALKRAFQIDTADAFNGRVRQENVVVTATELNPEELLVKFTAPTINGDAGKAEGEAAVTDYAYPVVWELYRDVESRIAPPLPPSALIETTTQNCNFKGEDWDYVWETKEEAVKDAFGKGVSDALGLDRESITDVVMEKSADGIAVGGRVTHVLSQKSEWIQEALKRHPFAEMWALYESRPIDYSKLIDTEHKLIFEGEDWVPVMEAKRAEVETAVRKDTAEALGGKEEDVLDVQLSTDEAALTAVLVTRHTIARTTNDVDKTLTRCDYDRVWDLYRDVVTALPPLTETTTQDCGFEGEDWDYVWETQEQAVREAFTTGVAEALGLEPAAVTDMTMEKTADGIIFGATVTHPPSQEYDDIQEALTKHPFAELWVLYEPRPFDPTVTIDTDHALSFEGDRWATVMARQAADVEAAIRKDTAAALEVEESNVTEVKTEVTEKALLVTATVRHSPLQDAEFIEEQLSSFDYDTVWGLYSDVLAPAEGSKHFDGVHWAEIIVRDEDGVVKAFNTDAATATQTKESEVDVMELAADANGLDVTYMVSDTAKPADAANQDLQTYAYPTLWDHYRAKEDVIEKERAAAALKALGERESGQLQRVFPGDDWDIVLEGCPEDAKGAFKKGVANTVGVPSSNVVVVGAKLGSLIMDYKVRGCPLEDDEIGTKIGDHDFPELMELYRARVRTRDEENESAARAKAEKETAEQAEKDRKEEEKRKADEAREAEEREARETEEARRVAEAQAEEAVALQPGFSRLALSVVFEGELWERVVRDRSEELRAAFRVSAAAALGFPADKVFLREYIVSEDSALLHFSAVHPDAADVANLREKVDAHPFTEVWALYDAMEEEVNAGISSIITMRFLGDDWDLTIQGNPEGLKTAFAEETAAVLRTAPENVMVKSVMGDDLTVDFQVRGVKMLEKEMASMLDKYDYPKVWALYQPRNPVEGSNSQQGSRRRTVEEGKGSQDSVSYLRKALADARQERDMYMEQVERASKK